MSEIIKEFKKGDLLYIDKDRKAQWGQPEGYPYKDKNKTVIEWDGNTEGLYCVSDTWYLVSDEIISNNVLRNGTITAINKSGVTKIMPVGHYWDALVQQGAISEDITVLIDGTVVVVRKPGASLMDEGPFERTGTYFVNIYGTHVTKFISETETIHLMDSNFFPIATTTTLGAVKQMSYLPNATGDAPTAENFNQLLRQLRNAGLMK